MMNYGTARKGLQSLPFNERQWTLLWATYEASLGTYWTLLRTWSYKHQDRSQNNAGLLYFCKIHPNCRASAGPVSRNISSVTICVSLWVRESGDREYYGKQMTGDCIYRFCVHFGTIYERNWNNTIDTNNERYDGF